MLIDLKPGARNALCRQRLHQRLFVHDGTARRVYEICRGAHEAQLSIADEMDRLRAKRGIHRDEVRLCQKTIQAPVFNSKRSFAAFVQSATFRVKDAHGESPGASRY